MFVFLKIAPKLFMGKLNIVSSRNNFVAISRRNRQPFRQVEIRLNGNAPYNELRKSDMLMSKLYELSTLNFK